MVLSLSLLYDVLCVYSKVDRHAPRLVNSNLGSSRPGIRGHTTLLGMYRYIRVQTVQSTQAYGNEYSANPVESMISWLLARQP